MSKRELQTGWSVALTQMECSQRKLILKHVNEAYQLSADIWYHQFCNSFHWLKRLLQD